MSGPPGEHDAACESQSSWSSCGCSDRLLQLAGIESTTPELDKRKKVIDSGRPDTLQEFVDWLSQEGIVLATWQDSGLRRGNGEEVMELAQIRESYENLFARHFGLDPKKISAEQDALLAAYRQRSVAPTE